MNILSERELRFNKNNYSIGYTLNKIKYEKMYKLLVKIFLILTIVQCRINANPQLDLPATNESLSIPPIRKYFDENQRRIQTNGHSDKITIGEEQSNENGVDANIQFGDALNYDRDRSQRYGPPYTDANDRRYYTNYNNENDRDEDEKYYANPRPSPDPFFVSEKQRNRYASDEYQKYYRVCFVLIR